MPATRACRSARVLPSCHCSNAGSQQFFESLRSPEAGTGSSRTPARLPLSAPAPSPSQEHGGTQEPESEGSGSDGDSVGETGQGHREGSGRDRKAH